MVRTKVAMVDAPPMVEANVIPNDPLPSHNTSHMFSPRVGHMHDNIYLHAQQIDKMGSIISLASSPHSTCICTLHVDAHILYKCYTMAHCHM